jgi:hypothetical protein
MIAALITLARSGNAGARHQTFAGLTNAYDGGICAETRLETICSCIGAEACNIISREQFRRIAINDKDIELSRLGLILDDNRFNPKFPQRIPGVPACIGFLYTTC